MTKQGIIKSIRNGTISAGKDDNDEWRIDPAELFRVYTPLPAVDDNQQSTSAAVDGAGLQREIVFRDEKIAMLVGQLADLRGERDRLLGIVETQAQQVKQLTEQRPAKRRKWWPWG